MEIHHGKLCPVFKAAGTKLPAIHPNAFRQPLSSFTVNGAFLVGTQFGSAYATYLHLTVAFLFREDPVLLCNSK